MDRNKIREKVFEKNYRGDSADILFGDLPKNLVDTDIIDIHRDEGYYSENNSWDANSTLEVYRIRDKNPEELEKDKEFWRELSAKSKKKRYETYLELKKEFDAGGIE